MKNVGDGFYLNSYLYYESPEGEQRYQVIYSARDKGHVHIENSIAENFASESAALRWIDGIKQDPEWKNNLENKLISSLLNGLSTKYQLMNFDSVFADWSEHEKALALAVLTKRAEKLHNGSFSVAVALNLQQQLKEKENCTSYGEPQAFYSLKNGRFFEIVIEQEGLSPSEYFYSVSLHCTGEEFDNGDYNSTAGIIDRYVSTSLEDEDLFDLVAAALACNDSYPVAEHSKVPLVAQISAAKNITHCEENQQNIYIEQER